MKSQLKVIQKYQLHLKKRLGQNILIDSRKLEKIISAAEICPQDEVIEIGAGTGNLTKRLAERASQVLAIEIDRDLISVLKGTLSEYPNVQIIEADFLKLDLPELIQAKFKGEKCKVVANLPYYITTPIIMKLLQVREFLSLIVLTVQLEVAQRIVAKPGTKAYGAFSIAVQFYTKPQLVTKINKSAFFPQPEVDSAVVKLEVLEEPVAKVSNEFMFFKLVEAAFRQRRKMVKNALSGAKELAVDKSKVQELLKRANIDPKRRGETLSIEEFALLSNLLSSCTKALSGFI